MSEVRQWTDPIPKRMATLRVDERGYPVPWFVQWVAGKPEFRAMDPEKWVRAVRDRRCWVCGETLGIYMAFLVGPMCGINRTSSEPPSHRECATWSAKNCPFLSRPEVARREGGTEGSCSIGGMAIKRNPGVSLVWVTRGYRVYHDGMGGRLIELGPPVEVEWWSRARPATREEVEESVRTGLPSLMELATAEGPKAVDALNKMAAKYAEMYPPASPPEPL